MNEKSTAGFVFRNVYPSMRGLMGSGRRIYDALTRFRTFFNKRPLSSPVIPDAYGVCNTRTVDSEMNLNCLEGEYPQDLDGSLFICQCLGSPEAFMVGDTNIVRLDFKRSGAELTNRLMWNPAAMARIGLADTKHKFDFFGLMYLSPGVGLYSYTEGLYLLPDGRIAVTSDVDRPWIIERDSLRAVTPLGRRDEWLPMISGKAGEFMGNLFAGYNNSHVIYSDNRTGEVFLANFQYRQPDGSHPVHLMRWTGAEDMERWLVLDEKGDQIEIKQSIHELVFTRDYILLADTAFVAGTEMLTPWVNAPLPSDKTAVYIVDRRDLSPQCESVRSRKVVVDEACIHILAEYDNPDDRITAYMLHTPATNTAELIRKGDRDLDGKLYPEHLVGYGTLPVLDLSSVGRHVIHGGGGEVLSSDYIARSPYTWGPYLYTYMGRQTEAFTGQDLFIMFKGFSRSMLPERIYRAYKEAGSKRMPIERMTEEGGIEHNNCICRISTDDFAISDAYVFPDRVLLYTIACLQSSDPSGAGYVIAGVASDESSENSSGHEYWLFSADDLGGGPLCRLGHESLNNSTLFHTVYIPSPVEKRWNRTDISYNVSLEEDYPEEELKKWDPAVPDMFRECIWPYFDRENPENRARADEIARSLSTRRIDGHAGEEYIIGEEPVEDAPALAERMAAEAMRIWSTSGWKRERTAKGITVESKPVSGPFAVSGILVMRSRGIIEADPSRVFGLLTSPEGYAILDPVSRPEDHHKPPLQTYGWKEGARLEAARAEVAVPFMAKSEFVVLNAIDPDRKLFVSKSIIHPACPGASLYCSDPAGSRGEGNANRALNTMAILARPAEGGRCELFVLNYIDMAARKGQGAFLYNQVNRNFFHPLYGRIRKHLASDGR